eukprot:COSAG04_NODE_17620_length_464_cov_0.556164_1_plen_131_part_01
MPKKKKSFIDKKNASTYQVVHRAARDPLSQDDSAPQMVLTPSWTGNDRKRWQDQQRKAARGQTVVKFDGASDPAMFGDAAGDYSRDEWELSAHGLPADGYDYGKHMKEVGGGAYTGAAADPVVAQARAELE